MSRAFVKEGDVVEPRLPARRAEAIAAAPVDRSVVGLGATVRVDDAGTTRLFTIVPRDRVDPANGAVSSESPIGAALMGARVGRRVRWKRPAGGVTLTVTGISYPGD